MNRALVCGWLLVIAASAAILITAGARALSARAEAVESRLGLISMSHQATELHQLRRGSRDFPHRPEGGLAAKVAAAMSRAGLAGTILQSLSPEAQTVIAGEGGTRLSRQRVTLTLSNVSLPQVGLFLDAWRTAEPDWIVSGIDLSPINSREAQPIGTDLPLRALITIEGVFKDPPTPGAPR